MRKNIVCIGIITLLFLIGTAHAVVWYVHPDSTLNCIQDCLDSCSNNDTVLVAASTYYENIIWPDRQGIKLMSESGAGSTIIDGGGTGRVIAIARQVDSSSVVQGFTIQNGYTALVGGGIYLSNTSPKIIDNIITGNYVGDEGGGIYCFQSLAIITGNTITHNTAADNGGGIACYHISRCMVSNNTISYNIANYVPSEYGWGGGIYCGWSDTSLIMENTITHNAAYSGGGIACWNLCSPTIRNNTISNDSAVYGGGIRLSERCSPVIIHTTLSENKAYFGDGIYCYDRCLPSIDSCTISNNDGIGIACYDLSEPVIHYNNITGNTNYGVFNYDANVIVDAENNWWGDPSGPGGVGPGTGDKVSDFVDYDPWLEQPVGVKEGEAIEVTPVHYGPTIFSGQLQLPKDKKCRIYDITGRVVTPNGMEPGIYFIEIDNEIVHKVIKVK